MEWYLAVLKKYFRFRGRTRRKEYWYFQLVHSLITILLLIISKMISPEAETNLLDNSLVSPYIMMTMIPNAAVTVRRLHDTGKSAWWYFIQLIPLLGFIMMLMFLCDDSEPKTNQYGANPKSK